MGLSSSLLLSQIERNLPPFAIGSFRFGKNKEQNNKLKTTNTNNQIYIYMHRNE